MPKIKNATTYIFRLTAFAFVSIVAGIVILTMCFAPATNPSFVSGVLFRGNNQNDINQLAKVARMFTGPDSPSVAIYDTLARPDAELDYKKIGLDKPEVEKFRTTDGVELEGWLFPGTGPDTALVCYNGFGKRLPLIVGYVKMLKESGLSVFLFDYRGLNNKAVKVSAQTACVDGQAAYDYLTKVKAVAPEHLVLIGRDLGAHVCLKIAAANKCKALILENPWATVKGFLEAVPGALAVRLVPAWLYTDDCLNNVHLVGKDHPPILVVAGDPEITDSGKFFEAISPPKASLYVEEYMPALLAPDLDASGPKYGARLKSVLAGEPMTVGDGVPVNWHNDLSGVFDLAKKDKKLLLVDFGASWCVYCRKMDRMTYTDQDVVQKLNKDFVAVKLDTASKDAQDLAAKYPFRGIPTAMVLDPDGNLKEMLSGFIGPDQFLKKLNQIK